MFDLYGNGLVGGVQWGYQGGLSAFCISQGQFPRLDPQSWAYQWCWWHLSNNIFKKKWKMLPSSCGRKEWEKYERNSPADQVSEGEEGSGASGARGVIPCNLWRRPSWGLNYAEAHIKTGFWKLLQPIERSPQSSLIQIVYMLEQGITDKQHFMARTHACAVLEERSTLEQFVNDCILWKGLHTEAGKSMRKKE